MQPDLTWHRIDIHSISVQVSFLQMVGFLPTKVVAIPKLGWEYLIVFLQPTLSMDLQGWHYVFVDLSFFCPFHITIHIILKWAPCGPIAQPGEQ